MPEVTPFETVAVGDARVSDYCKAENIPILLEMPDDRRIAEAYSLGRMAVEVMPEYEDRFVDLLGRVTEDGRT